VFLNKEHFYQRSRLKKKKQKTIFVVRKKYVFLTWKHPDINGNGDTIAFDKSSRK